MPASKTGFVLLTVGLALAVGSARPAAADGLRLREAIDRALAQSPLLAAADHERRRAEAAIDRSRAGFLPRLDASYGYTRSDQPVFSFASKLNQGRFSQQDFDVGRLNDPGATDNFRGGFTLRQPLFTGGKTTLGLEQAQAGRRIAELEMARATQEVTFQVARAYFGLRLAQERRVAVEASVRAAEANRALAESRYQAGLTVESDVLAARVRLARLREEALTAQSQFVVAGAVLNDAMGASIDAAVEALDPLVLRPAGPDGGGVREILERRPDYRVLALTEEMHERDVRLARAEFWPTLEAEGSYEVNSAHAGVDGQGSWSLMAVLRWNLFGGGVDAARVREAEATRQRVRALRARAASRIEVEVRESREQLDTARERTRVAGEAIAEAEETLRILSTRYRNGLATIVDLLVAEAALAESRLRLSRALHDYNVGLAAWELALGRLDRATFE